MCVLNKEHSWHKKQIELHNCYFLLGFVFCTKIMSSKPQARIGIASTNVPAVVQRSTSAIPLLLPVQAYTEISLSLVALDVQINQSFITSHKRLFHDPKCNSSLHCHVEVIFDIVYLLTGCFYIHRVLSFVNQAPSCSWSLKTCFMQASKQPYTAFFSAVTFLAPLQLEGDEFL